MSSTVTFCFRCGSALSEGSAFCMVCGAPADASANGPSGQAFPPPPASFGPSPAGTPGPALPPAYAPPASALQYPGAPVPPGWYGAPYPAGAYAPQRAPSGGNRPMAILMIAVGSIALVVALVGGLFMIATANGGGVSVTPDSFSCAGGTSRLIEFNLPDLPQSTKLTITITNDQGSGVSSYSASVSNLSQYLQANGGYLIKNSGDSGAECSGGPGTYTYAIWNDDTKEKLLSGTFTVTP